MQPMIKEFPVVITEHTTNTAFETLDGNNYGTLRHDCDFREAKKPVCIKRTFSPYVFTIPKGGRRHAPPPRIIKPSAIFNVI